MRNAAVETERAPEESVQPNVSGDPPEKRKAIAKIAGMLPEFDEAYIEEMADQGKCRAFACRQKVVHRRRSRRLGVALHDPHEQLL